MRKLIPLLLVIGGCDLFSQTCTLKFAPSSLTIDVEASGFEPGTWDIELDGDLSATCTVVLPQLEGAEHCDHVGVFLGLSPDATAIETIEISGEAPEFLEVAFVRDGVELDRFELTPDYDESEPNGPGCGLTFTGTDTITLD